MIIPTDVLTVEAPAHAGLFVPTREQLPETWNGPREYLHTPYSAHFDDVDAYHYAARCLHWYQRPLASVILYRPPTGELSKYHSESAEGVA